VALVRVLIGYMFIKVVTESKTCRIYEAVLQIIKAVTRNLSVHEILYHNTARLDVGLLLFERV
jgi:hypothetical protein